MIVFKNKILPLKGFKCLNLCGFILIRSDASPIRPQDYNHEAIHTAQMKEIFYVPFYIWYILEYIMRLFQYSFDAMQAYRNISFEREAYDNQDNLDYLYNRPKFMWIHYLWSEIQ